MVAARPLRDVFTELTGDEGARASDPVEVLRANGHADLPDGLVAEAVVTFADTAPIDVAQHLATYVAAHSPVPVLPDGQPPAAQPPAATDAAPGWLETLTTAPAVDDDTPDLDAAHFNTAQGGATGLDAADPSDALDDVPAAATSSAAPVGSPADGSDLDFGQGPAGTHGGEPGPAADGFHQEDTGLPYGGALPGPDSFELLDAPMDAGLGQADAEGAGSDGAGTDDAGSDDAGPDDVADHSAG